MTSNSKDYFKRVSKKVDSQINKQAKEIAKKLAPMMHSGDAHKMSQEEWYQAIRSNWFNEEPVKIGDQEYPNWRAAQAMRIGPVKLVEDALEAHGLHKSLLKKNADAIVHGLPPTHDATEAFGENMRIFHDQGKVPHHGAGGIVAHAYNHEHLLKHIPHFAAGGIVSGPTLALVGENGPEAIIPLDQKKQKLEQGIDNGADLSADNTAVQ